MNDREQATMAIRQYMDLLRIESATDRDKEIANQKREQIAILEALGVRTLEKIRFQILTQDQAS